MCVYIYKTENILSFIQNEIIHFKLSLQGSVLKCNIQGLHRSCIVSGLPSLVAQMVKNLPVMQETQIQPLGQADPLEKGMATYSSILPWRTL